MWLFRGGCFNHNKIFDLEVVYSIAFIFYINAYFGGGLRKTISIFLT